MSTILLSVLFVVLVVLYVRRRNARIQAEDNL